MNKRINLVYWNKPNFGDQLSPYIINKLSGLPIQYKRGPVSVRRSIKEILKYLICNNRKALKDMLFSWEHNIIGIGSVINLGNHKSHIWGSGFMIACAVRGEYTNNKIISMGYSGCCVFGDPALLLPLVYEPTPPQKKNVKNIQIGIVPHFSEVDYFIKQYGLKYTVIDLRTFEVEKVIDEINSCQYVLSSSLHGIIVAHAYHIPCIWIQKGYIHTDGIKFYDYFSSVNIPIYEGFTDIEDILSDLSSCLNFFERYSSIALPHKSLVEIQQDLLDVAPFPVKQEYRNLLKKS